MTVSLAVHGLLLLGLLGGPIDLGDRGGGGAVAVSLVQIAASAPASASQAAVAIEPQKAKTPKPQSDAPEKPAEPVAAPDGYEPAQESPPEPEASPEVAQTAPESVTATDTAMAQSVAGFVALAVAGQAGQPGESCKIAEWLEDALRHSPEVVRVVALVPRETRSVANALMLWNGYWVQPPTAAAVGYASLKQAIVVGLQAAPPHCLQQALRGPLFIMVGDERDAVTLAMGAGEWRWADLLVEPAVDASLLPRTSNPGT